MTTPNHFPLMPRRGSWASQLAAQETAALDTPYAAPYAQPVAMPRPSVRSVLQDWGPWDCCMALMGVCDDGIPLAARFFDAQRTSHYVFYGQDDAVLATLVMPMLYSMSVQEYGPEYWQYTILSEETTDWSMAAGAHCQGIVSPYERDGDAVIPAAAGLMEQRSMGRQRGPRYVVVLHDLGRYWHQMSINSRRNIIPLLKRGHQFGINVLVTLRYEHYPLIPKPVRRLLKHKVYGLAAMAHLPNTTTFRELGTMVTHELLPYQAWVRTDGEWMRYTAPRLG